MLKNKVLRWLIALLYIVLFAWMWMHSKQPSLQDIPLLFGAGLIVALLCLISFNQKTDQVFMIINIVLFIANIVMYFAAYRVVTGALNN